MQQLLGRMLASTDKGHRLLRAPNGQRALSLLRERKPDLMLLDLVMPGMDGYAVLREKSLDVTIRDIPVVVVSARDPVRESIISNSLTLVRAGGLTLRDLLTCLRTWGEVMGPATPDGPASQGRPDG
jgi:CheY-like chemotaxis protein